MLLLPPAVREWCLLAARFDQDSLTTWIEPEEFAMHEGTMTVLRDRYFTMFWYIRELDFGCEDPPVFCSEGPTLPNFAHFSEFVTAMVLNGVLCPEERTESIDLSRERARAKLNCLIASSNGELLADGSLETATVIAFAYPADGPVLAASRTQAGRTLIESLR
jgi:hypothetical protein